MKKLKELGRGLTRKEMKSISGGYRQCGLNDGFVCGPVGCPDPYGPYVDTIILWQCDSPTGACRHTEFLYA